MHPQFFLFLLAKGTRGRVAIRRYALGQHASTDIRLAERTFVKLFAGDFIFSMHARTSGSVAFISVTKIGIRSRHRQCGFRSQADVPFCPRLIISGYAVAKPSHSLDFILGEIFWKCFVKLWNSNGRCNDETVLLDFFSQSRLNSIFIENVTNKIVSTKWNLDP